MVRLICSGQVHNTTLCRILIALTPVPFLQAIVLTCRLGKKHVLSKRSLQRQSRQMSGRALRASAATTEARGLPHLVLSPLGVITEASRAD